MKFFTLFKNEEVHISSTDQVIPAEEFSTFLEAKELVQVVQDEAKKYKKSVVKENEVVKEDAYKAGYLDGMNAWAKQVQHLEEETKKNYEKVEELIIPIALKAAKKIVDREISLDQRVICDIVAAQLKAVSEHKQIQVYVNKDDLEILEKEKPELAKIFSKAESFSIQEREDIEPNGCIIETELGIIRAELSNQWKILENIFSNMLQSSQSSTKESDEQDPS